MAGSYSKIEKIRQLQAQLDQILLSVNSAKAEKEQVELSIKNANKRYYDLVDRQLEQEETIKSISARLNDINSEYQAQINKLEELKDDYKRLDGKYKQREEDLKGALGYLHKDIELADKKKKKLENEYETILKVIDREMYKKIKDLDALSLNIDNKNRKIEGLISYNEELKQRNNKFEQEYQEMRDIYDFCSMNIELLKLERLDLELGNNEKQQELADLTNRVASIKSKKAAL